MMLLALCPGLASTGCGWKPQTPSPPPLDTCKVSDGSTTQTVQQAIILVPILIAGSIWVEMPGDIPRIAICSGCRSSPTIATESTPQQLLFFDHNTRLGAPTRNPKAYNPI